MPSPPIASVRTPDGAFPAEPAAAGATGALPDWDLGELYAGPDDARIAADLDQLAADAARFEADWKDRIASASGDEIAGAIAAFERIEEQLGRLDSYASLLFAADATDPVRGRLAGTVSERGTASGARLLFFTLELAALPDEQFDALLAGSAALRSWRSWLRDLRVFRPHLLEPAVERVLHEKEVTGRAAWHRLFDQTMAGLRVSLDGNDETLPDALNNLSGADRELRRRSAAAIGQTLEQTLPLPTLVTNTLAKDKAINDDWRRYERPASARNRANMVEDEVVDALVAAVEADHARTSHRYYAWKARTLGLDRLQHWDRNAPLPGAPERVVDWPGARAVVGEAYRAFDPTLGAIVERFFTHPWIDAAPRPGKAGGAFAHPTVPSLHPFILMNFHGRTRDVMTLAHELGHGVHQVLAAEQGLLRAQTPLTLAETASVFGEMLVFERLLAAETDPVRRRNLLAGKVEDMLNTAVRQISFYRFELRLHEARRRSELLPGEIGALWLDVQRASLGPAFELGADYAPWWAYVPHFVHTPFYVYAYAFGDGLVNALYAVFKEGSPGFQARYLDLLRAGGTERHRELLAPFGLDAADPGFWRRGLDVLAGLIDTLEAEG